MKSVAPTKWHAIFLVGPCLVGSQNYVSGMLSMISQASARFNFSSVGGYQEAGDANFKGQDAFALKKQLMDAIPSSNHLVGKSHMAQNPAVVSRLISVVGN